MTFVYAIIIFLLLIFVHEAGHLLTAKLTGIKVNEFSLGMGPKIFSKQRGETKYSLRWIPIGGYCAMEGEDEESYHPRAFGNKPAKVRALVLFAGSLMNIVLAIVLLSALIFYVGVPGRTLDTVAETAPAYADGLKAGDTIIAIEGVKIKEWNDISAAVTSHSENESISLTVIRDGSEVEINTHLYKNETGELKLGITPKYERTPLHFFSSFGYGAQATFSMARLMYDVLGDLVTGRAGMDQLTGPVGIVKTVGDTAKYGLFYLVQLTALISLNLGIINLLPFPALDGGRLIFLLIRKITGKKITDEIEGRVHLVGILVLFGFMALITVQDIGRFLLPGA